MPLLRTLCYPSVVQVPYPCLVRDTAFHRISSMCYIIHSIFWQLRSFPPAGSAFVSPLPLPSSGLIPGTACFHLAPKSALPSSAIVILHPKVSFLPPSSGVHAILIQGQAAYELLTSSPDKSRDGCHVPQTLAPPREFPIFGLMLSTGLFGSHATPALLLRLMYAARSYSRSFCFHSLPKKMPRSPSSRPGHPSWSSRVLVSVWIALHSLLLISGARQCR